MMRALTVASCVAVAMAAQSPLEEEIFAKTQSNNFDRHKETESYGYQYYSGYSSSYSSSSSSSSYVPPIMVYANPCVDVIEEYFAREETTDYTVYECASREDCYPSHDDNRCQAVPYTDPETGDTFRKNQCVFYPKWAMLGLCGEACFDNPRGTSSECAESLYCDTLEDGTNQCWQAASARQNCYTRYAQNYGFASGWGCWGSLPCYNKWSIGVIEDKRAGVTFSESDPYDCMVPFPDRIGWEDMPCTSRYDCGYSPQKACVDGVCIKCDPFNLDDCDPSYEWVEGETCVQMFWRERDHGNSECGPDMICSHEQIYSDMFLQDGDWDVTVWSNAITGNVCGFELGDEELQSERNTQQSVVCSLESFCRPAPKEGDPCYWYAYSYVPTDGHLTCMFVTSRVNEAGEVELEHSVYGTLISLYSLPDGQKCYSSNECMWGSICLTGIGVCEKESNQSASIFMAYLISTKQAEPSFEQQYWRCPPCVGEHNGCSCTSLDEFDMPYLQCRYYGHHRAVDDAKCQAALEDLFACMDEHKLNNWVLTKSYWNDGRFGFGKVCPDVTAKAICYCNDPFGVFGNDMAPVDDCCAETPKLLTFSDENNKHSETCQPMVPTAFWSPGCPAKSGEKDSIACYWSSQEMCILGGPGIYSGNCKRDSTVAFDHKGDGSPGPWPHQQEYAGIEEIIEDDGTNHSCSDGHCYVSGSCDGTAKAVTEDTGSDSGSGSGSSGSDAGSSSATDAPATDAPATDAPETDAPATSAPETDAPATDAPATDAPETDAPTTEAPETEAPATDAPETDAPATEAPETEAPATDAPETEPPATEVPGTEAPATDAPETEAPATDAPEEEPEETEAPATDAPAEVDATEPPASDDTEAANEGTEDAPAQVGTAAQHTVGLAVVAVALSAFFH